MASEDIYRSAAQRTHRTLGSYLVQWAWTNSVDCVVVKRADYLRFVGIKVMQNQRVGWLKQDVRSVFRHAHSFKRGRTWSAIYLSRHAFPGKFPWHKMPTDARVKKLRAEGLSAAIVQLPDEKTIVEAMARVACGIEDFSDAPWAEDIPARRVNV